MPDSRRSISLYLADDHRLILEGIQSILSRQPDMKVLGTFGDGASLLEALRMEQVDVLLIDLNMPNKNGVDVTKYVKKHFPQIKIIILSMISDTQVIHRMIKHGADGYLLKNDIQDELVDAIHQIVLDKSYFNKDIKRLLFQFPDKKRSIAKGRMQTLTPRELEVGQLIVNEHSTPEIAALLHLSPETIISHRKKLLQKLEVKNTAGIVRKLISFGYVDW